MRSIKVSDDDFGLLAYDPGLTNTASTKSSITHIDGEKGILRYRGYPYDPREDQAVHGRLQIRRPSHGHAGQHRGRAVDLHPESRNVEDPEVRALQIRRLVAKMPTIAAFAYRSNVGFPSSYPDKRAELHGELPEHDVQDDGAAVQA